MISAGDSTVRNGSIRLSASLPKPPEIIEAKADDFYIERYSLTAIGIDHYLFRYKKDTGFGIMAVDIDHDGNLDGMGTITSSVSANSDDFIKGTIEKALNELTQGNRARLQSEGSWPVDKKMQELIDIANTDYEEELLPPPEER